MSVLYTLHAAEQTAAHLWSEHTKAAAIGGADGLTLRQLALLEAINDAPGSSQTQLVEMTRIDRSTLADIVRRLVRRDLVKRVRQRDDARAYALRLTPAGVQLQRAGTTVRRDVEAAIAARVRGLGNLTVLLHPLRTSKPAARTAAVAEAV